MLEVDGVGDVNPVVEVKPFEMQEKKHMIPIEDWIMDYARQAGNTVHESGIEMIDLAGTGYIMNNRIKRALNQAIKLKKGLFLRGKPGCGKTEVANSLWKACGGRIEIDSFGNEIHHGPKFVKIICNPDIDSEKKLVGEWDIQNQMVQLEIMRSMINVGVSVEGIKRELYSERFLIKRGIIEALTAPEGAILLIDEADKSRRVESFLLEFLDKWRVSIPQMGEIKALKIPMVIITANRAREFSEEFHRRCVFVPINYPDIDTEIKILHSRLPNIRKKIAEQISSIMSIIRNREVDFRYTPGTSSALDWAQILIEMNIESIKREQLILDAQIIMKHEDDMTMLENISYDIQNKVGLED